ncbi:hypothetical protein LguiB_032650 [Lonicera macranthoides]
MPKFVIGLPCDSSMEEVLSYKRALFFSFSYSLSNFSFLEFFRIWMLRVFFDAGPMLMTRMIG